MRYSPSFLGSVISCTVPEYRYQTIYVLTGVILRMYKMSLSLLNTFTTVLLVASLTCARSDAHGVENQDGLVERKWSRGRRQNLADLPSWTSPGCEYSSPSVRK